MRASSTDTIVAQATPPGRGGVGILRLSGPQALSILTSITGIKTPVPRHAAFTSFHDIRGGVIDQGISIYFCAPHSFTGEDVVELQGHGGPMVLSQLLNQCLQLGARLANPGEFSERAFLNDKIDLAQAEAIADLIDSGSEAAARSAMQSLQGTFSRKITDLGTSILELRMFVEAAIDFPDEDIDFLSDGHVLERINECIARLDGVLKEARQGVLLRDGMKVVLAGKPNAGKSSLLNQLAGSDRAIVTDVAGTTRDLLREFLHIDGMPVHVTDTAGLRVTFDEVEREGIRRAWQAIQEADRILLLTDASEAPLVDLRAFWSQWGDDLPDQRRITIIRNKIDLTGEAPGIQEDSDIPTIRLSAKCGSGLDALKNHLKAVMGFEEHPEGHFTARQRHLDALRRAREHLGAALTQSLAGELLAEDLRQAHNTLGEITGRTSPDDLLGHIFSSFCIGK